MQYTIENVPEELDRALRERATMEQQSLNDALVDALAKGLGIVVQKAPVRDLSDVAGTWEEDPETEAVLQDHERIDPEMWQ